jgi:hypothetical protein
VLSQLRDVLEGETFVEVPAELGKYWPGTSRAAGLAD